MRRISLTQSVAPTRRALSRGQPLLPACPQKPNGTVSQIKLIHNERNY